MGDTQVPLVKARVRSDGRVVSWGMGDDWLLVLGLFGSVLCEGVSLFSGACNTDSSRTLSTVSASVKTQLWQRSSTGLHIVQKGLLTIALISLVARCGVSVTQFRCSMQRSQHGRQMKCLHGRLTSSGTPVSVQRGGRASQSMQVVLGHSAVCRFACVGRLAGDPWRASTSMRGLAFGTRLSGWVHSWYARDTCNGKCRAFNSDGSTRRAAAPSYLRAGSLRSGRVVNHSAGAPAGSELFATPPTILPGQQ